MSPYKVITEPTRQPELPVRRLFSCPEPAPDTPREIALKILHHPVVVGLLAIAAGLSAWMAWRMWQ